MDPEALEAIGITPENASEIEALAAVGIGEGDFDDNHGVPPDLLELHEALEWQRAVAEDEE
jgi:hypothetical protein